VGEEDIVCCAECRMLQERGARCAACGATTLVARLDQLFAPRLGASVDEGSTFSSPIAGTLALMGLAVGMGATLGYVGIVLGGGGVGLLMCFGGWGVGLAVASALHSRRVRLTRLALTAADAKLLPGPEEHAGVVERSGETVAAPVTGRHCLACTLSIVPGKGKPPYYWSAANAGFWLIGDDGRRVHVAGPVWIEGGAEETVPAERTAIAAALPDHGVHDALGEERRLEAGARIVLSGVAAIEMVAGVAYRDAEELVVRGKRGQPLVARRV
jgi:hypothetical protein